MSHDNPVGGAGDMGCSTNMYVVCFESISVFKRQRNLCRRLKTRRMMGGPPARNGTGLTPDGIWEGRAMDPPPIRQALKPVHDQ